MSYSIKPMNVSGILDESVYLFRNRFKTLLAIALILTVPFDFWHGLLVASNVAKLGQFDPHMSPKEIWQWYAARGKAGSPLQHIVTWVNILLFKPVASAAFVHAASSEYLNTPATAMASILKGLKKLPSILWASLIFLLALFGVGIGGAFVIGIFLALTGPFVVVPITALTAFLIYIVMRLALINPAIVIENKGGLKAFERSGELMAGHYSQFFVIGLLIVVFRIILASFGLLDLLLPITVLRIAIQSVLDGMLVSYFTCAVVVFYYSCRCQRDHFDLTTLADTVKSDAPPAIAPPSGHMPSTGSEV